MKKIPRPEYPRPQMVRPDWMNLNGEWYFETDNGRSGRNRGLVEAKTLSSTIIVPFCPESKLSGIGNVDFMTAVWYKRTVKIPAAWRKDDRRTIIHIGACDYNTEVYVNGVSVGTHIGGYISFSFDITNALVAGENLITIAAYDDVRGRKQPTGKQSQKYESYSCCYTRTTGIWQTVWLENVENAYIDHTKLTPDVKASSLLVEAVCNNADGMTLVAEAFYAGKSVGKASGVVTGKRAAFELKLKKLVLWNVGDPKLYDLKLTLGDDKVDSYFGMRDIVCDGKKILINGKTVFQRLILDQGFYPDGIYTAPTDAELQNDIKRSLAMGFNGARLHEKIFEERFLYHCDKLGYIVWGEHANWGLNIAAPDAWQAYLPEWMEEVRRDYNHPAIVGWCPLNETQADQNKYFVKMLVDMTHELDGTRPVIDSSGWFHVGALSDIDDTHDYDQNPETLKARYEALADENAVITHTVKKCKGRPVFISEYGGIWWNPQDPNGWGYGERPKNEKEFIERFRGLTHALLDNPNICALCYTQLTDVEQEQNGLYTYARKAKFDPKIISKIMKKKAAIEK